jgi:hypothetical protein
VRDTVGIDSGYSYFVVADSGAPGINAPDTYSYFSVKDNVMKQAVEQYNYNWFYTNEDYREGMVMDSLVMFNGDESRASLLLMPPVDTAMHRCRFYSVVRDFRWEDFSSAAGEAFQYADGYLQYTEAYARSVKSKAGVVVISNR